LLYFAYIVRNFGHQVLYLGQSTPLNVALDISEIWNPDIIITGALSGISVTEPDDYIMKACKTFPGKKILFAGLLAETAAKKKIRGVFPCRTEADLRKLLK
jgi:hypothetical protein